MKQLFRVFSSFLCALMLILLCGAAAAAETEATDLRKQLTVKGDGYGSFRFLTDGDLPCHSFRINFSTPTDEDLTQGIKEIGKLAKEVIG